jgi:hypothetical protein
MFAQAASGKLTPEEAMRQTNEKVQRIFQKWRDRSRV